MVQQCGLNQKMGWGQCMRLTNFVSIEDQLEVSKVEFLKRANVPPLYWMPSRQHVYTSQCEKYSDMLLEISECSNEMLILADQNPSQFIKAAQDYQLAARTAKRDRETIVKTFLRLGNIGMLLRRYNYEKYKTATRRLSLDSDMLAEAGQLHGLLRAYSEGLYFDDHTVSGEFYGGYSGNLVVRAYKRMRPIEIRKCAKGFDIERVLTFCTYAPHAMDFDCLGNPVISNVRPVETGLSVIVCHSDGQTENLTTVRQIQDLECKLSDYIRIAHTEFSSMCHEEKEAMLVQSSYYAFKPILELMGVEWMATQKDVERYHKSFTQRAEFDRVSEMKSLTEEEIMRIIDPRRDL